jgi:hypothetical protein
MKTSQELKLSFKRENRGINRKHVEEIKESIEKNGYLSYSPIITNDKGEIIDGQHRFLACQELGIEPFVLSIKDCNDTLMIDLNKTQRSWRLEEFINFYAEIGNENYQTLRSFMKDTNLAVTPCIMILTRNTGSNIKFNAIKDGRLEIDFKKDSTNYSDCLFIADCVNKISRYMKLPKGNKIITDAFLALIKVDKFDPYYLIDKVSRYRDELYLCGSFRGYYNMFVKIYNQNKRENKLEYLH